MESGDITIYNKWFSQPWIQTVEIDGKSTIVVSFTEPWGAEYIYKTRYIPFKLDNMRIILRRKDRYKYVPMLYNYNSYEDLI